MPGFRATVFSERKHKNEMKSQRFQLQISKTSAQTVTRQALQSHFRREMAFCGLILLVMAAWIIIYFMPSVRSW
jgi:hypothetical protein